MNESRKFLITGGGDWVEMGKAGQGEKNIFNSGYNKNKVKEKKRICPDRVAQVVGASP